MLTDEYKKIIHIKRAQRELLDKNIQQSITKKQAVDEEHTAAVEAMHIIQEVAKKTMEQISTSVSDVVTQALHAVFPNPYSFEIEFVTRRNQTECDLWLVKGSTKIHPLDASGGGVLDVVSFALRSIFLILKQDSRPLLILDEPFKFVSADLQKYCGAMLKNISEKLNFQVIIVTHIEKLIDTMDRVFRVQQIDDVSLIV